MFDNRLPITTLRPTPWGAGLGAILALVASTVVSAAETINQDELKNLAARIMPEARIDFVMFDSIETRSITPNAPDAPLPMVIGRVVQYRWTQFPELLFSSRDFLAPKVRTSYFKSNEEILSPRYQNRRCKDTWTYVDEVFSKRQVPGERHSVCSEDAADSAERPKNQVTKEQLSSPPDIETNTIIGTYNGVFAVSDGRLTEKLEANVKSKTQLTFNGPPGKMYWVDVKLHLESGALNPVTRTLQFTPIACKGIKIGTATTDRNCIARIRINPSRDPTLPNMQSIDVTPPSIAGKILKYSLSVAAGPLEK